MGCLLSSADTVVSPGDVQRFPVDKTRCDLAPCAFVNLLHGRAGNIHLYGTLLVGLPLQVNQPNDLILVQRQQDRLGILAPVGAEGINLWCATKVIQEVVQQVTAEVARPLSLVIGCVR